MEIKDHLDDLEDRYQKELKENQEAVDCQFESLIVRMDKFLKEYKKYCASSKSLHDLQNKLYGEDEKTPE